ncbi:hypothetical protein F210042A8_40160 [Blautia parvula]
MGVNFNRIIRKITAATVRGKKGPEAGMPLSSGEVKRSESKIHLPQTLGEEVIADEPSDWEQVS